MSKAEGRAMVTRARLLRASMDAQGYYRDDYTEGRRCAGPGCRIESYAHDYKARGTRAPVFCSDPGCREAVRFVRGGTSGRARAIQDEVLAILDVVSEKKLLTNEQRAQLDRLHTEFRQQLDPAARLAALRQQLGK